MKYAEERLREAASACTSVRSVCIYLGIKKPGGSIQTHISNRLKKFDIDTSHFLGRSATRGWSPHNKRSAVEVLVRKPAGSCREHASTLRWALVEIGRKYSCEHCDNPGSWQGEPMNLEVDHIDCDWLNNLPENLRFLCPNCHTIVTATNSSRSARAVA